MLAKKRSIEADPPAIGSVQPSRGRAKPFIHVLLPGIKLGAIVTPNLASHSVRRLFRSRRTNLLLFLAFAAALLPDSRRYCGKAAVNGDLESVCHVDRDVPSARLAASHVFNDLGIGGIPDGVSFSWTDHGIVERGCGVRQPDGIAERRLRRAGFAFLFEEVRSGDRRHGPGHGFRPSQLRIGGVRAVGIRMVSQPDGPRLSQGVWEAGRWIANLVGIGLAVDFLNFSLPDVPRSWHWLTPGTGFVVLTLVGASRAVRSLCPAFFFLSEDLSGRSAASLF